jgi:hypothetical protein
MQFIGAAVLVDGGGETEAQQIRVDVEQPRCLVDLHQRRHRRRGTASRRKQERGHESDRRQEVEGDALGHDDHETDQSSMPAVR